MAALTAGAGCTSLLGLGGDFTVQGNGGATSSSSASASSGGSGLGGGGATSSSTNSSTSTGGTGGAGGGFVETGPITGHSYIKQIDDQGIAIGHRYLDFSAGSTEILEAWFQKANGQWATVNGIGAPGSDASGNFSIPATIDGPYILHIGNRWAALENRNQLDFDTFSVANFDVPTLTMSNDPTAQYDITGMRPWQDGDILEFLQPSTGVYSYIPDPTVFSPVIMPGDTFVDSTTDYLTLTYYDTHLIDPTLPVHVFHLSRYGTDPYQSIAGYAAIDIDVPDSNGTFAVTAANFAIPSHTTTERHVIIHNDQFDALVNEFNPNAVNDVTTLNFSLQPVPYTIAGQLVGTADLAASDTIPPGTNTINIDFFFGNPFPQTWQLAGDFRKNVTLDVTASGATTSTINFTNGGCLMVDGDALLDSTHPLVPQVHPVTNAKIDGKAFFGAGGALTTAMSKITWTAPTGPAPVETVVQAMPVVPDGSGGTRVEQFGGASSIALSGTATSVTLPPGFVASGSEYLFRILTYYSPTANHELAPGRTPATLCFAETISNKFATP